jgi:aminoglycoside phosphotransferase (APT) family kinase protein
MTARPAPTRDDRAWLVRVLHAKPGSLRIRRLDGGISSAVHAVAIRDHRDEVRNYVLRRWSERDVAAAHDDVRREAAVLTSLTDAGLPAPRLVASDARGEHCSAPALLMTRVPGGMQLDPIAPELWLRQLAEMLPRVHAATVEAPAAELWHEEQDLHVPDWSSDPGLWKDALALFRSPPPAAPECFIHRDYQPFNTLWTGEDLTGVVDWVSASHGSPDIDVGHCRLNLSVLYSPDRAAQFLGYYESAAGRTVDPWWDVACLLEYLPGWGESLQRQAGLRLTVDFGGIHQRVEQTLRAALGGRPR